MFKSSVLAYVAASKCPFGFDSSDEQPVVGQRGPPAEDDASDAIWPVELLTCPSDVVTKTESFSEDQYMELVEEIMDLYNTFADSDVIQ